MFLECILLAKSALIWRWAVKYLRKAMQVCLTVWRLPNTSSSFNISASSTRKIGSVLSCFEQKILITKCWLQERKWLGVSGHFHGSRGTWNHCGFQHKWFPCQNIILLWPQMVRLFKLEWLGKVCIMEYNMADNVWSFALLDPPSATVSATNYCITWHGLNIYCLQHCTQHCSLK